MNTVQSLAKASIEVKQSKFIAHLVPISEFDGQQDKLRAEHPKSRHVVYALRYLNEHDQIVENSSDDGEPKGSSGVPALNVLRGEEMINTAVLIVRYFGGTKLGIGGLVRAYTDATKAVIEISDIIKYEKVETLEFNSEYAAVQRVEYLLNQLDISGTEKIFDSNVKWRILATQEKLDEFKVRIGRLVDWSV